MCLLLMCCTLFGGTGGIEKSSGVSPIVCGKPSPWLARTLCAKLGVDPSRAVMVGDRFSDMEFGQRGGMDTLMVLTGCTSAHDVVARAKAGETTPTHILQSFGDIGTTAGVRSSSQSGL